MSRIQKLTGIERLVAAAIHGSTCKWVYGFFLGD